MVRSIFHAPKSSFVITPNIQTHWIYNNTLNMTDTRSICVTSGIVYKQSPRNGKNVRFVMGK